MNKFARHYIKHAFSSDEILPMTGAGPFLSDYLVGQFGANRAGRAHAMASASGTPEEEIPYRIKHPIKSNWANSIEGAAVGGLAGTAIGAGVGSLGSNPGSAGQGALVGGLAGVGIGSLVQSIRNLMARREDMRNISHKFNDPNTKISPKQNPVETSEAEDIFLPFSGFANKGERDTHRYLSGQNKESPHFDMINAGELGANFIPYVNMVAAPASGIAENMRSRHPKQANFIHHYLTHLNKHAFATNPAEEEAEKESRLSKILKGGLGGAAIGGLGLGAAGAVAGHRFGKGVAEQIERPNAVNELNYALEQGAEHSGANAPLVQITGEQADQAAQVARGSGGLAGGGLGGAAGILGGGVLGALYGAIR